MQLVFLCGGTGSRMGSLLAPSAPKCLINLIDRPILGHLLDNFLDLHDFNHPVIFIVRNDDTHVANFVSRYSINAIFLKQKKPDGVVNAILLAKEYISVDGALFILGDIVANGHIIDLNFYIKQPAMVVWQQAPPSSIQQNFGIKLSGGFVDSVIEKPENPLDLQCGMGLYFLNERVLSILNNLPANPISGEREITDGLAYCINEGILFRTLNFNGFYCNINRPDDLFFAERILSFRKPSID